LEIVPFLLLAAVFFGFPPLFLAMLFSHIFPNVSVLVRTLLSAMLPAILYFPISFKLTLSEGSFEERFVGAMAFLGWQLVFGLPVAYLKSRRHPVPDKHDD
jgi:uncharacterized membrane protein